MSNTGWIKWRSSAVQEIILNDFDRGGFLYRQERLREQHEIWQKRRQETPASSMPAGDSAAIWVHCAQDSIDYSMDIMSDAQLLFIYKVNKPEFFTKVVLSQFSARMKDYRVQASDRFFTSRWEERALQHDLALHPRQKHNSRGELEWHLDDEATELLRVLVKEGHHKKFKPEVLWYKYTVFQRFDLDIFRPHIYQEERYQKYVTYLEESRRQKQTEERAKNAKKAASEKEKKKKAEDTARKQAEKEQEQMERKRKKAEDTARKQAEKEREQMERKRKKAEDTARKQAEMEREQMERKRKKVEDTARKQAEKKRELMERKRKKEQSQTQKKRQKS